MKLCKTLSLNVTTNDKTRSDKISTFKVPSFNTSMFLSFISLKCFSKSFYKNLSVLRGLYRFPVEIKVPFFNPHFENPFITKRNRNHRE
ncbi:hypothetical protein AKJ39_01985 [candidate division MSBL1 archaeon SCGC-AAA259J03]|uniref:Uncharacterized protein n=1 Tax=candidate division MSBL1 archaeon SCGC-AAA259J03 TaxID=1698269 RepID=A0A656YWD5_9EURY|nr:hypothetical protein AKJ39_01985 [candidate division MSBL1 archaeon SCGC-AAA259J03]